MTVFTSIYKKIAMYMVIATILLVALSSCQSPLDAYYNRHKPFGGNELNYDPNMDVDLDRAWKYVSRNNSSFTYIYETDRTQDYWKSPIEFEADGGGDCEDFCVYLMYLLGENANTSLVYTKSPEGTYHALVKYKNIYLEAQWYGQYYYESDLVIITERSYTYVMNRATNLGSKSIATTTL